MKKIAILLAALTVVFSISGCKKVKKTASHPVNADYRVIPLPNEISLNDNKPFVLTENTTIFYEKGEPLRNEAEFLRQYLSDITDEDYLVEHYTTISESGIYLRIDSSVCPKKESYRIDIDSSKIIVTGGDDAGVFYAVQTLRKSIPAADYIDGVIFPAGTVNDFPKFSYRGMHLDVSRHFFDVDTVKRYIDMMAMHNINKFHWHLTDDQGWRIQIDKYPLLTKVGAWRSGTVKGRNTNSYDSIRHGGFYTKTELREIVNYAADRHITIIPEFDLPGHTQALLAAYPQFGCTGGPYDVWQRWGVTDEVVCAGNEEAMRCLENILNEIMDIFPSEIIHVGGDECPKIRWHECSKCQAKIKELKLKSDNRFSAEDYLQSYVMNRMEKVVEARGRKILGWDEILEGDISETAMIMNWRELERGFGAAANGHDVVMTPGSYFYFDHGQSLTPENEPVFADGYLPVEQVYSFSRKIEKLDPDTEKHIVGIQANLWTEYIPNFKHAEYDALPRMAALCEIQWRQPGKFDYRDFVGRCFKMKDLYDVYNYNYATHIFDLQVDIKPDTKKKSIVVTMSNFGEGQISYTLDGKNKNAKFINYTQPVEIRENADFKAKLTRKKGGNDNYSCEFRFSKSSMKPITLKNKPHENYAFDGAPTLADGLHGNSNYRTGRWIGFWGTPLEATIDLQQPTQVSKVRFGSIININDWIYNPKECVVMVSDDGRNFRKVASEEYPLADFDAMNSVEKYELVFNTLKTKFLRVIITGHQLPPQHSGFGHPAWLFVDEIEIE